MIAFASISWVQRRVDKKTIILTTFTFLLVDGIFMVNLRFFDLLPENGSNLLLIILISNHILRTIIATIYGIMGASVMADILDYQEYKTGKRQEGMFFSAISFSGKAVSGLGIVIAGIIIDLLNFPKSALPSDIPAEVIVNLGLAVGVGIPLFYLIPIALFSFYRLTRSEHERIYGELLERRARSAAGDFSLGEFKDLK